MNHVRVRLDPADLIQSGGEGMVFALDKASALKLYHQPNPERAAKLEAFLARYTGALPAGVLAPLATACDRSGKIVGFQMARLPRGSAPLKQLEHPNASKKLHMDTGKTISLFLQLHSTLSQLHQQGIVVGDLNDHNIHLTPGAPCATYWLDVDSYQFASFPCPVALISCLDPQLYHIKSFAGRPAFTPETDWYAYFVLLIKALLHVHPFGGAHKVKKSLETRASAGITILDPQVKTPMHTRPVLSLTDELIAHFEQVFVLGRRPIFPEKFLTRYQQSLVVCPQCRLAYPSERVRCPRCHVRSRTTQPAHVSQKLSTSLLLQTDGEITYIAVGRTGRIRVVIRRGGYYDLVEAGIGGVLAQRRLFEAHGVFRFGSFGDHLIINPASDRQLLVLDVSGRSPRRVTMQDTGIYLDKSVFATTPDALYRLAGGFVMRGIVRDGHFLEDIVGTARPNQTQLWASAVSDVLMGSVRVFAERHTFLLTGRGANIPLNLPAATPGDSVSDMTSLISKTHAAVLQHVKSRGNQRCHHAVFTALGAQTFAEEYAGDSTPHDRLTGKVLIGATIYHPTDAGVLLQNASTTTLMTDTAGMVNARDSLHAHPAGLLVRKQDRLLLIRGRS